MEIFAKTKRKEPAQASCETHKEPYQFRVFFNRSVQKEKIEQTDHLQCNHIKDPWANPNPLAEVLDKSAKEPDAAFGGASFPPCHLDPLTSVPRGEQH